MAVLTPKSGAGPLTTVSSTTVPFTTFCPATTSTSDLDMLIMENISRGLHRNFTVLLKILTQDES